MNNLVDNLWIGAATVLLIAMPVAEAMGWKRRPAPKESALIGGCAAVQHLVVPEPNVITEG